MGQLGAPEGRLGGQELQGCWLLLVEPRPPLPSLDKRQPESSDGILGPLELHVWVRVPIEHHNGTQLACQLSVYGQHGGVELGLGCRVGLLLVEASHELLHVLHLAAPGLTIRVQSTMDSLPGEILLQHLVEVVPVGAVAGVGVNEAAVGQGGFFRSIAVISAGGDEVQPPSGHAARVAVVGHQVAGVPLPLDTAASDHSVYLGGDEPPPEGVLQVEVQLAIQVLEPLGRARIPDRKPKEVDRQRALINQICKHWNVHTSI
mmetsp:Transcript_34503/g.97769  ORF Transcript_34503/g.97769 Transcript_34503/m.97769 type:complete len:261 (-) Transcript_34503:635-1417(-)